MTNRALCVGINQFSNLPMASWLNGCVNDANDMAAMLRKRGFAPRSVTVLTDDQATKANVMAALTKLVETAKEGDHIVFSFSSHGTQVPDTDGDDGRPETDGADEAFACYDMAQKGDQWDPDTVIIDDELRADLDLVALMVTRSEEGMSLFTASEARHEPTRGALRRVPLRPDFGRRDLRRAFQRSLHLLLPQGPGRQPCRHPGGDPQGPHQGSGGRVVQPAAHSRRPPEGQEGRRRPGLVTSSVAW